MSARWTGMETHGVQRPVSHRGACFAVAALFVLAALTGAVATSHAAGHLHRTQALVAATAGTDVQAIPGRSGVDAAPVRDSAARLAAIRLAHDVRSAGVPPGTAVETPRTRGPPAAAL